MDNLDSAGTSGPRPQHAREARRLIAACGGTADGAGKQSADAVAAAVEQACRKITHHLEPLITRHAVMALLARSVYLSKPRFEFLAGISTSEVNADVVRELPPCLCSAEVDAAFAAALDVLGNFVWLLTRFVSDDFGLRLLREACPDPDKEHA
jgi:hypothetical protein